jgi:hypothetical protein
MSNDEFGILSIPLYSSVNVDGCKIIFDNNKHILRIFIYRKYSEQTHWGNFDIIIEKHMSVRDINQYICHNIDYHPVGARFYKINGEEYDRDDILIKFIDNKIIIENDFCVIYQA